MVLAHLPRIKRRYCFLDSSSSSMKPCASVARRMLPSSVRVQGLVFYNHVSTWRKVSCLLITIPRVRRTKCVPGFEPKRVNETYPKSFPTWSGVLNGPSHVFYSCSLSTHSHFGLRSPHRENKIIFNLPSHFLHLSFQWI